MEMPDNFYNVSVNNIPTIKTGLFFRKDPTNLILNVM